MPSNEDSLMPRRDASKKRTTDVPVTELAAHAVDAALDKKARDMVVMDMREVSGVADIFVVCTGDSDLQIRAIIEAVEARIREHCAERPWHVEGKEHYQWVLMDYVDLVFCHRPDTETPIEETVRAMNYVIDQGYAFYWGTSEWSAEQIRHAYEVARREHLVPPTMEQPQYNLFHRERVETTEGPTEVLMVHAGLWPEWTPQEAERQARQAEPCRDAATPHR